MKPIRWSTAGILISIGGIALLAMMGHVVADVVGRTFFGEPIDGTLEIVSGYYMVAVVFLPLAFVTRGDEHIYVELFTRGMRAGKIALLDAIVEFVALLFVGFLAWQSAVEAVTRTAGGETWETAEGLIAIWPSRWLLPLSLLFMTLYLAARVSACLRAWRAGRAG
jgi:TRAP-type C4-dicarboxylate transport system permease small subunit